MGSLRYVLALALVLSACASAPQTGGSAGSYAPPPPKDAAVDVQVELLSDEAATADAADDAPPPPVFTAPLKGEKKEADKPEEGKPELADERRNARVEAATAERSSSSVDPATIKEAVARRPELFRPCLQTDSSLELVVTISPSGSVLSASSPKSMPDEQKLRDCVADAFKRLTLAPPGGDSPSRVKFALALKKSAN